jgi:hypothetical protein
MTATAHDPGIRQPLYLAGFPMVRPAATIGEKPARAETAERMADSFTVVDRPYLPITNPPDVVIKYTWQLAFPRVGDTDYRTFARAEALPGFIDFCLWKPISEIFSGDGVSMVFSLLRRNALTQIAGGALPPSAATIYAVQAYIGGSLVTTPSFGSPDAATGVTQITFGSAPAAGSSNVEIFYVPLFKVLVTDTSRDFPDVHRETRAMTLVEI